MKKIGIVLIGSAMLLFLLAAGCGSSSEDPATRIDNAYNQSLHYETVHLDYDVNLTVEGDVSALGEDFAALLPLDLTVSGSGDVDNSDRDNPRMQTTIEFDGLMDLISGFSEASGNEQLGGVIDSDMIENLLSDLEVRIVDKVLYVRLLGTWYEADMNQAAADATGESADVDTSCIQDAMEAKLVPSVVLTDITEVGDEDVDGDSTTHFSAKVDVGQVTDALAEVTRECDQAEAAGALEGASSELTSMFRTLDVDLWLDGDDNLRKMTATIDLDPAAISGFGGAEMEADEAAALESLSITVNMSVTQSNFDEDVDITAPEDAQPFEELAGGFGDLGSGFDDVGGFGGSGTSTDDSGTSTRSSTSTNPFST